MHYLGLIVLFSPILLIRMLLIGKVCNASRKEYLAINKDERDNLYTSGESLYTTKLEGIYICQTCFTPIASTDSKISAEKPNIIVGKLFDESLVNKVGNRLICTSCQNDLGEVVNDAYRINGEKLALDANELHLIYP